MKRKLSRIIVLNLLPPIIFFSLLSTFAFLVFIPGVEKAAESGAGTREMIAMLMPYTIGVLAVTAFIFILTSVRSMRMEISREKLKLSADQIDQEYQNWVESTADGFIFIPLSGRPNADETVCRMLECSADEFGELHPEDFINRDVDGLELLDYLKRKDSDILGRYETRLLKKDAGTVEVLISASRIDSGNMNGFILIIKDMSDTVRTDAVRIDVQREYNLIELQSALQYIYQNAGNMMSEPLLFNRDTVIISAVEQMNKLHKNTFIVINDEGYAEGIVTDQDLRQRILSGDSEIDMPVSRIMSCPIVSAPVDLMFFEAFRLMRDNSIRQLVINDDDGKPVGLLTEQKLIEVQSTNAAAFSEELMKAETVDEMRDCYRRLVFSVRTLVQSGAKASYIMNLVSKTSETITCKLIEAAFQKFGPPPCKFAFLAMGSEGRREQTLLTDQDNAIVFADAEPDRIEVCRKYFLKLGGFVSRNLDQIGYAYCKGGVMASNDKWVKSAEQWRYQILEWFAGESSNRMLDLNILFDFRCIYGDPSLGRDLRTAVWNAVDRYPGFLREVASAASALKPPLTIFGRLQVKHTEDDYEIFDIKKALGPLTIYARMMSLKERVEGISTTVRLRELKERGLIAEHQCRNYLHAFDFLSQLRFREQVRAIDEGDELSNMIYIVDLSEVEIISLRRIYKQIASAQDSLKLALTGTLR